MTFQWSVIGIVSKYTDSHETMANSKMFRGMHGVVQVSMGNMETIQLVKRQRKTRKYYG